MRFVSRWLARTRKSLKVLISPPFFMQNDFTAQGDEPYVRFASVEYDATAGDEKVRIIEFDELNRPGRGNSFKQEELYLFKEVSIHAQAAVQVVILHS